MLHTVGRWLTIALLVCLQTNLSSTSVPFTINSADRNAISEILSEHIHDDMLVKKVSFSSDVIFSSAEFNYLFGIENKENLSCSDCALGIDRIFKKEKFDSIACTITKNNVKDVEIHLDLQSMWTFGGLRFKGILVGRERLGQYYMMETGEPFDKSKHEHSLKKIQTVLRHDGYLKANLKSILNWDKETKTVCANIKVNRGDCFVINAVNLVIKAHKHLNQKDCERFTTQLRKRYLSRMVGSYYSKYVLDKEAAALKDYLARHGYPSIQIQLDEHLDKKKGKVRLNFTIELCAKRVFSFVGNEFFSRKKLLDKILCFGKSSWLLPVSILAQEIEQAYHDKGFWGVAVVATEKKQTCEFVIVEGNRARLIDIQLKGVDSYNSSDLTKLFFDTLLYTPYYYDEHKLADATNRLCSYYYKNGFWSMKILDQRQVYDENSGDSSLVITIDEGPCTYINNITVAGVEGIDFDIKENIVCSEKVLEEQKKWLANECKRLKLDVARVYPEYTKHTNGVDLVWNVELSDTEDVVGKTIIVGSSTFPFEYVAREIGGAEGSTWNHAILNHSLKRIKHLQIFEQASLRPCSSLSEDGERDIIARLYLDDQYEARVRLGAGLINTGKQYRFEDLTYKAGGSLLFKNVSNCADNIKFEADATRTHRILELGYWRPWILDMPVEMLTQGYYNRYEYPGLLRGLVDLYSVSQHGLLLGLTRAEEYGTLSCNVGIEWMRTTLPDERPCLFDKEISEAINFEPNLVGEQVPYLWFEPTFYVEWLDNKLSPHRGFSTLLTMKAMAPVSKTKIASYFVKIMAEQCVYVPFFHSVVLALRMRGGYIFHKCFKNIMPTERFYLGGLHSIRSYDTDLCPPLGKITDECTGKQQLVPQGGKAMVNGSFELRFPVYENFGGVLFQDIGYLSGSGFTDLLHSELLLATGVGVRYNTPISPLRFDLGFKWSKPDESMSRYAWFLSFGHPF